MVGNETKLKNENQFNQRYQPTFNDFQFDFLYHFHQILGKNLNEPTSFLNKALKNKFANLGLLQ